MRDKRAVREDGLVAGAADLAWPKQRSSAVSRKAVSTEGACEQLLFAADYHEEPHRAKHCDLLHVRSFAQTSLQVHSIQSTENQNNM